MGHKILIIEDNAANMELETDLLEVAGYTVLQAFNAETGLNLAQSHAPDLILMDVSLPGMDGLTASCFLLEDERTKSIPIVVVTAHAMKGDQEKALAVGCAGYISKPIDTRSFARVVGGFIGKSNSL